MATTDDLKDIAAKRERLRKAVEGRRPSPPPIEFAGQWVAWNQNCSEVIAHGKTMDEAHVAAAEAGYPDAPLMKVPRPNAFLGAGFGR